MQSGRIGIFFFINIITARLMRSVPKNQEKVLYFGNLFIIKDLMKKNPFGFANFPNKPNKLVPQFWHPRKAFYFNFLILFTFLSHLSCTYLLQQKQNDFSSEVFSLGVEFDSSLVIWTFPLITLIGLSLKNISK